MLERFLDYWWPISETVSDLLRSIKLTPELWCGSTITRTVSTNGHPTSTQKWRGWAGPADIYFSKSMLQRGDCEDLKLLQELNRREVRLLRVALKQAEANSIEQVIKEEMLAAARGEIPTTVEEVAQAEAQMAAEPRELPESLRVAPIDDLSDEQLEAELDEAQKTATPLTPEQVERILAKALAAPSVPAADPMPPPADLVYINGVAYYIPQGVSADDLLWRSDILGFTLDANDSVEVVWSQECGHEHEGHRCTKPRLHAGCHQAGGERWYLKGLRSDASPQGEPIVMTIPARGRVDGVWAFCSCGRLMTTQDFVTCPQCGDEFCKTESGFTLKSDCAHLGDPRDAASSVEVQAAIKAFQSDLIDVDGLNAVVETYCSAVEHTGRHDIDPARRACTCCGVTMEQLREAHLAACAPRLLPKPRVTRSNPLTQNLQGPPKLDITRQRKQWDIRLEK